MDARQFPQWGKYMSQIGWKVEKIKGRQIFIRQVPWLGFSVIKFQRPKNPIPFTELEGLVNKYHTWMTIIEPDLPGFNHQELIQHGFQEDLSMSMSETATIKINLKQNIDALWKSFSENARRNIKKAQNNHLTVKKISLKDATSDQNFKQFFTLLVQLAQSKKFYIPSYQEFYKKMLSFQKTSVLFFAYSQGENQPVAALWLGFHHKTAVYMHIGINDQGYSLLANYLLAWEAIRAAKNLGFTEFDFEGIYDERFPKIRKTWAGFTEFKKRFHGQIINYPKPYVKCYNFLFKLIYLCNKVLSQ